MKRRTMLFVIVAVALVACVMFTATQTFRGSPSTLSSATQQNTLPSKTNMRTLNELIDKKEPGIEVVREWIRKAKTHVEVLGVDRTSGEKALLALQVTSRSPMGAIALETGGLLIDHGWVRVLGGGSAKLPRPIHEWNRLDGGNTNLRLPGTMLVGDDALGGFFALNGDGLKGEPGHVFYYSPQTLEWEDVADSYSEWLAGIMMGDLNSFYEGMRWTDWQREVEALAGDRAFSVYPFLFASGPDIAARSRRAVPLEELWGLYVEELPKQLLRKR